MDQPALGNREGFGGVHRIDGGERCTGAEPGAALIERAERGGGVDHHADGMFALQPGIAVEIDRGAEGGVGQHDRDPVAIVAQQAFLGGRARGPIGGVDVTNQRGEARPQRRLRGRRKGECRHQREAARDLLARRLADCDHQAERRVADRKTRALPTEQLRGCLRLERADLRAVVAEDARVLDAAQRLDLLAQAGRIGGDQGIAHSVAEPD